MSLRLDDIRELDDQDPLRAYRDLFHIPAHGAGQQVYLCGNSLGLQVRSTADAVNEVLNSWRERAVEGHFEGKRSWTRYHDLLRKPQARIAGAKPSEIVTMNTLTVNLHLLMISFFRPRGDRNRIVIEQGAFPSDRYAVQSQLRLHGLDPANGMVEIPANDERLTDESVLEDYLDQHGEQVALVLWPGVHYATGQRFDLGRIASAAKRAGACVGFDLAHAIGNVPLDLHGWGADFAVWCTYKYLNGGPGAIAGAFIHEQHHGPSDLPRLDGWWGVDLQRRFLMEPNFHPAPGADAWQLSTPPALAMAPLLPALDCFEQAGMDALRLKSIQLTGTLERLIREQIDGGVHILTPDDAERRGCQLSLRVRSGRAHGRALFEKLQAEGIIGDWREPDVIRVAPVPLYNTFEDCWRLVQSLRD